MFNRHNTKTKECVKKMDITHQGEVNPIHHIDESTEKINMYQAIEITKKFLEQHHNVSSAKAIFDKNKWFVTMCVGMSKSNTRQVQIDAVTGKILGYT